MTHQSRLGAEDTPQAQDAVKGEETVADALSRAEFARAAGREVSDFEWRLVKAVAADIDSPWPIPTATIRVLFGAVFGVVARCARRIRSLLLDAPQA